MHLSEAILLGDSLGSRDKWDWLEKLEDGSYRGCAMGRAVLAAGIDLSAVPWMDRNLYVHILWPWLTHDQAVTISRKFTDVCNRYQTIEDLVDYVRSIEPAEPVTETNKEVFPQCEHSLELHL